MAGEYMTVWQNEPWGEGNGWWECEPDAPGAVKFRVNREAYQSDDRDYDLEETE